VSRSRLAFFALIVACADGPTGPAARSVSLAVADGDAQFGTPGSSLEWPFSVRVTDASRGGAVKDVEISWRITSGSGAAITIVAAKSDGLGIASARLRLGPDTGTYRAEPNAPRRVGAAPVFSARAIPAPVIESSTPALAAAGQTVTITGRNFSATAEQNAVLFGGLRGRTLSATATTLTAEVPRCALSRSVDLRVAIGAVESAPRVVQTVAGTATPVNLNTGQARRFEGTDLECLQFSSAPAGTRYLAVSQNAVDAVTLPLRFELRALSGSTAPVTFAAAPAPALRSDAASDWELRLRLQERSLGPVHIASAAELREQGATADPQLGESREFNVLKQDNTTRKITAVVQAISQRAILYVDRDAPSGGLTAADLQRFGDLFDNPIYTTDVEVYGTPSDTDANGKVIILFTPAVNALTSRSDAGFIAGYFYGCDLVARSRCSATNSGEIFYSMVPDPSGQFSGARTKDVVLRTVPGVLAHEFQHMINFHRKGGRLDVLWLSEGLAHSAEDIVGDQFLVQGDVQTANDFKRPNYVRAQIWLSNLRQTHVVAEDPPGSLELRGAGWLLVRYLTEHYGGTPLLGQLTASTAVGAANITAATSRAWKELLSEFGVAVWADRAPDLAGVTVDPRHTFGTFDLRARIGALSGGFPLNPPVVVAQDFLLSATMASAAADYLILQPSSLAAQRLHLIFAGPRGGPFTPPGAPQLTLLRIR